MSRIAEDLANGHHNSHAKGGSSMLRSFHTVRGHVPKIAVVGAGISGLRCADILIRSGADVTVFEARNRVGGRVHQVESGGHLVDLGPNWIHGTHGNPIMKLAERTRTALLEPEEEAAAVFDYNGNRKSEEDAAELAGTIWGIVVEAFKYSDENSARIDSKTSLLDFFRQELSKKVKDKKKMTDLLEEAQVWGPMVGDPVQKQSLKFFFLEECIDGENVFVAGTYKDILKEIGRTASKESRIRFNQEVTAFNLGISREDMHGKIEFSTADSQQHSYDEVVITMPLGWLKRNHEKAFTPALPARLSQAIQNINYGRLEKLYITFPTAFWLQKPVGESSALDREYPVFTRFYTPSYTSHPSDEPWNQSMLSLAHLPGSAAHPTLLFYIYGPCATSVVASVTSLQPHSAEYNSTLNSFSHPFYRLLPNYSPTDSHCIPTSFLMTQWQNDPFAGNGSYCNFQVGLEQGDEDIKIMRDAGGLTEQGLWMAGEHTAPFIALGTTTGAWWSGEGVARRICTKYRLEVPPDEETALDEDLVKKCPSVERADAANLNGMAL